MADNQPLACHVQLRHSSSVGEEVMRLPIAMIIAAVGATSVSAQDKAAHAISLAPSCSPVAKFLAAEPATGGSKLFILTKKEGFVPVSKDLLLTPNFQLPEYRDGQALRFLYAPRPIKADKSQYLAIRTRSVGVADYDFVALKKQKKAFSKDVEYGTYKQYHEGLTDNSRTLRHYHNWDSDRSDTPELNKAFISF